MSFNQRHKAGRDIPEIFDGEVVILPLVKSTLMIMMNGFWWKQKRMLEKLKANAAQPIQSANKKSIWRSKRQAGVLIASQNLLKIGLNLIINTQIAWQFCIF